MNYFDQGRFDDGRDMELAGALVIQADGGRTTINSSGDIRFIVYI